MSAHQRPWTLGAIVAADHVALKAALAEKVAAGGYRRSWLVVGGDHGYWREERLSLRENGEWELLIDGPSKGQGARPPANPERIPIFEARVREIVGTQRLAEGAIHVARAPGLLLLGYDAETSEMIGLSGYRELLEQFWLIRIVDPERLARGTDPGGLAR